ncbi:matrixin family metalloprotease [Streptomyces sp. NPDC006450]|uniref:matrixin family metalloprotease n=1 Tax=Streptomyces sp. NPDC006450 TaxID=3155458 RepID=UPI0033AC60CE
MDVEHEVHDRVGARGQGVAVLRREDQRRNVLVHELGHALGFCHTSDGGKTAVQSVMWPYASAHEVPTEVDKANYRRLWGS